MVQDVEACSAATYLNRVNNDGFFNWCVVPDTGYDVILFGCIAVAVACVCLGKFSSTIVLVVGAVLMAIGTPVNLGRVSNAISWWLGVAPYQLFFYVFLPPMALEAAVRINWFIFKKVLLQVLTLSYLVVIISSALMIPIFLYLFGLRNHGWNWAAAAMFGAMTASTDAVAVISTMKSSGASSRLRVILEGESMLNDASCITLFNIYLPILQDLAAGQGQNQPVRELIGQLARQVVWLAGGGALVGVACGIVVHRVLAWLRTKEVEPYQQVALTLAAGYLAFYIAENPCKVSGVVSVSVFGLYGSFSQKWGMSRKVDEAGAFDAVWDTVSYAMNAMVFFFSGVSCVNFFYRSLSELNRQGEVETVSRALWMIPVVYITLTVVRFALTWLVQWPLRLARQAMNTREVAFATMAGIRGSVSLILAQAVIIDTETRQVTPAAGTLRAEVALWTAAFVLLTLLINSPLMSTVMYLLGLSQQPARVHRRRAKAVRALEEATQAAVRELRRDADEMLTSVDWSAVEHSVHHTPHLRAFFNHKGHRSSKQSHSAPYQGASLWQRLLHALRSCLCCPPRTHCTPAPALPTLRSLKAGSLPLDPPGQPGPLNRKTGASQGGSNPPSQWDAVDKALGRPSNPRIAAVYREEKGLGRDSNRAGAGGSDASLTTDSNSGVTGGGVTGGGVTGGGVTVGGVTGGDVMGGGVPLNASSPVLATNSLRQYFAPVHDDVDGWIDEVPFCRPSMGHAVQPPPAAHGPSGSGGGRPPAAAQADRQRAGAAMGTMGVESKAAASRQKQAERDEEKGSSLAGLSRDVEGDASDQLAPAAPKLCGSPTLHCLQTLKDAADTSSISVSRASELLATTLPPPAGHCRGGAAAGLHSSSGKSSSGSRSASVQGMQPVLEEGVASESDDETPSEDCYEDEVITMRTTLLAGLRQYCHSKRREGLLSAKAMRMFEMTLESALEAPEQPLALWSVLEKESCGKLQLLVLVAVVQALRQLMLWIKKNMGGVCKAWPLRPFYWLLCSPLRLLLKLGMGVLNRVMLLSCELAITYVMALANSPYSMWLRDTEASPQLMDEIKSEGQQALQFIVDREIEAPERFSAIQSYRATMAVLGRQREFLDTLLQSGVLNSTEHTTMMAPLAQVERKLEARGPTWRAPVAKEVLSNLPFLHGQPREVLEMFLRSGRLVACRNGDAIEQNGRIYIVVSGLVKVRYQVFGKPSPEYFLGTGGMFGIWDALTGTDSPWSMEATAAGNAVGQGPVLFVVGRVAVDLVRQLAGMGDEAYKQVEQDMFRMAAMYAVSRLKPRLLEIWTDEAINCTTLQALGEEELEAALGGSEGMLPDAAYLRLVLARRLAVSLSAELTEQLTHATVVQLKPGQSVQARYHVVVITGTIHPTTENTTAPPVPASTAGAVQAAAPAGPGVLMAGAAAAAAAAAEAVPEVTAAPGAAASVAMMQGAGTGSVQSNGSWRPPHVYARLPCALEHADLISERELEEWAPVRLVAGSAGALLLCCTHEVEVVEAASQAGVAAAPPMLVRPSMRTKPALLRASMHKPSDPGAGDSALCSNAFGHGLTSSFAEQLSQNPAEAWGQKE